MAQRPVWAIDIGESSVKAIKMRLRGGAPEILEVDMIDFERNLIDEESDEEDRNLVVRQALIDLARRRNLAGASVIAAIPGRLTISKLVELPPTEKAKIPEMVKFEVQNVIPFPIDDIIWDYVLIPGTGSAGSKIEVNLLATKKESVYSFLANFEEAHITVDTLQTAPLALFNLVKADQFPDENVVVVDIGAVNSDLVIINENRFWVRNVPKAGNRLTDALQQKFQVSFEQAERLKVEATTPTQMNQVNETVRPVLRDLVGEISRTIGFYKSQANDATFDRILFLGNTIRVPGFKKFMSSSLPYKVDYLQNLHRVKVSKRVPLQAFKANLPSFGIAIGLGLQELGIAPNQVNLKPREREQTKKLIVRRSVIAASVLLLGIGMFLGRMADANVATVHGETNDRVKEVTQLPTKGEINNKIRNKKILLAGMLEPFGGLPGNFGERELPERVAQLLNEIVQANNYKEDGSFNEEASDIVLSSIQYDDTIMRAAERGRARANDTSKNTVKKNVYCRVVLSVRGADRTATRTIVEEHILPALRTSELTRRDDDGNPVVRTLEDEKLRDNIHYPLATDPKTDDKGSDYKTEQGYCVWEIEWGLASRIPTRQQILNPDESQ